MIPNPARQLFRSLHCFADESAVGPLAKDIWKLNVVFLLRISLYKRSFSTSPLYYYHLPLNFVSFISSRLPILSGIYTALKRLSFVFPWLWPARKYNEDIFLTYCRERRLKFKLLFYLIRVKIGLWRNKVGWVDCLSLYCPPWY